MPKVSVIIPAYNAEGFLERSVRSALAQTESDLEVIVVDDGSIDSTVDTAVRVAEEDRRVRVVRNGRNCGVAMSRNRAITLARGEWIALLDADDTWLPHRLETLLRASRGADVVCDDLVFVDPSRTDVSAEGLWTLLGWVGLRRCEPHWLTLAEFTRYDLGLLKPVIRRDFLRGHDLSYDTDLRVAEDYYLYFRLLAAGARWRQLPDGCYVYSRHADSLTRSPDAVLRQHLLGSEALLSDPAVTSDREVFSAAKRSYRRARASVAKYSILDLARQGRLLAIGRLLRDNPDYAPLLFGKTARHVYVRLARSVRGRPSVQLAGASDDTGSLG